MADVAGPRSHRRSAARPRVTGIVLAGGESTRFGRPKWQARIGGRTLLERAIDALQGWCAEVLVVGRGDLSRELAVTEAARFVEDLPFGRGPLVGLASGLRASRTVLNVAIACDMPFAGAALLQHLARRARGYDAVVPLVEGRAQPLHAAYHRRCAARMTAALARGIRSPTRFLERGDVRVRYVPEGELRPYSPDLSAFISVNTPQDLRRARSLLRRRLEAARR